MNRPPITSTSSISSYRKPKRRRNPIFIIYLIAALLIIGGIAALIYWLTTSPNNPVANMLATDTPTPTITFTPTSTSTPTNTATETPTATITLTPTFSAPFNYRIEEGDNLTSIVEKFALGDDGIAKIISLNPFGGTTDQGMPIGIDPETLNIVPGQIILLPHPDYQLPTATPVPEDLSRGSKIEYTVQVGDSLGAIAASFNTTVEAIMEENDITDPNLLNAGQVLVIPVNLVTPTPTRPPTSTPITPGPGTELPTVTMTPIN